MSDEVVIRHCSPTLAGLKTGSLFSYRYDSEDELRRDIRAMNRVLVPKGLRVLSLSCKQGRALIYLYRPSRLGRDLTAPVAAHLLEDRGYPWGDPDLCVVKLIQQLRSQEEFPHEIGLFLGYPPDDVEGFIHYGPKRSKCVGDWRVYGNEEQARRLFAQYRACTRAYQAQLKCGKTVEQLAVAWMTDSSMPFSRMSSCSLVQCSSGQRSKSKS